jgi:hypothetical protein
MNNATNQGNINTKLIEIYINIKKNKRMKYNTDYLFNSFKHRLKSTRCLIIEQRNHKHTVFYQNFGFPYTPIARIICFWTRSNTSVPTYNYLYQVILVQYILDY